jgi:hypothetical protein
MLSSKHTEKSGRMQQKVRWPNTISLSHYESAINMSQRSGFAVSKPREKQTPPWGFREKEKRGDHDAPNEDSDDDTDEKRSQSLGGCTCLIHG